MFFFGPESLEPPEAVHESLVMRPGSSQRQSSPDDASANGIRKHPREQDPEALAQPTPKRPRKSTITTNALQPTAINAEVNSNNDSMEIDVPENHDTSLSTPVRPPAKSARPGDAEVVDEASAGINGRSSGRGMDVHTSAISGVAARVGAFEPHAQEQPPSEPVPRLLTLTNGNSIGVQSEDLLKTTDLSPNTTILSTPQGQGLDVTKTLWRSNESSTLTGYGSEFCGIWNISSTQPPSVGQSIPYHSIFDKLDGIYVSAVAWDQTGNYLAVATYINESMQGRLSLYEGAEFTLVETLPAAHRMITRLHWANQQTLIGLAPCDDPTVQADRSTEIVLWDIEAANIGFDAMKHESVPELIQDLDSSLLAGKDLALMHSPGYICLAGEGVAYHYQVRGLKFEGQKRWEEPELWTYVRCSNSSQFVVAASDQSVWIPGSNLVLRDRHAGSIVDLQIRPRASSDSAYANRNFVEEFATASDDGYIRVWSYDSQSNIANQMFKVNSPSMALSYSPDGRHFAGARADKLKVWKSDRKHPAIGDWDGSGTRWRGASVVDDDRTTNGDVSMNGDFSLTKGDHSLSWDSQGNKIAFGLGEQVCYAWILRSSITDMNLDCADRLLPLTIQGELCNKPKPLPMMLSMGIWPRFDISKYRHTAETWCLEFQVTSTLPRNRSPAILTYAFRFDLHQISSLGLGKLGWSLLRLSQHECCGAELAVTTSGYRETSTSLWIRLRSTC